MKAATLGKSTKTDVDEKVFGEKFHMSLVHEAARAELNARRRGTASTKTRGEVAMTGAKAWRQKGTGRARAGALSTPQRYGGGVAFGPKPRHYTVKVNQKAFRKALRAALSVHADRGTLAVFDAGRLRQARDQAGRRGAGEVRRGPRARRVRARERGQRRQVVPQHPRRLGAAGRLRRRRRRDRRRAARPLAGRARGAHAEGVMTAREIVIRPVVSEKSYALLAANKYTFRVHDDAHKTQVRQAVEEIFGVRVQGVRTSWVKSKPKRRGWSERQDPALEEGGRPASPRGLDRALRGPGHRGLSRWRSRSTSPRLPAAASRPGTTTPRSRRRAREVARRGPQEVRRPQRARAHHLAPPRRRRQAQVPQDRLQAPEGRRAREGGGDRVRPEPLGAHRAAPLRRRREALHPRAAAPARGRDGRVRARRPSRRSATRSRSRGSRPAPWSTTSS